MRKEQAERKKTRKAGNTGIRRDGKKASINRSYIKGKTGKTKRSKNASNPCGDYMPEKPVTVSKETLEILETEEISAHEDRKSATGQSSNYIDFVPKKMISAGKSTRKRSSKKKKGFSTGKFDAMDVVIAVTGILVLLAAIGTIGVYSSANALHRQVEALASVGQKMENIGIAGEGIFTAAADARVAEMEAAQLPIQEESVGEYEEKELVTEMNVGLKLISVHRDLKIKFTNKNSGKLISNQPFSVDITGPESRTLKDEDKDGIIYIKSVTPGEYSVIITGPEEIEGKKAVGIKGIVTVKDKIEYKKIDVSDEVKKESEINTTKEDTAVVNQVESVLQDTVEWVESTKTSLGENGGAFEKIDKKDIPEPSGTALLDMIWAADTENGAYFTQDTEKMPKETESMTTEESESMSSESPEPSETELPETEVNGMSLSADADRVEVGKSITITASVSMSDGSSYNGNIEWTADKGGQLSGSGTRVTLTDSNAEMVTVKAKAGGWVSSITVEFYYTDKKVTAIRIPDSVSVVAGGTAGLSLEVQPKDAKDGTVEWKVVEGTDIASVDGNGTLKGVKAGTAKVQAAAKDGSGISSNICTVTVSADIGVTMDAPGIISVGDEKQLKCTASGEIDSVKWSVSDTKIASIEEGSGKVKGIAAGRVTVTVRVKGKNGKEVSATGELKVEAAGVEEMKLDPSSLTLKPGEKKTIKASVSTKGNKAVEWKSKDEAVVKIVESRDDSCVVQAIKPGRTTLAAVSKENKDKTASCEITVELKDGSAPLKDKDGNQLYYKDGDSYKEAKASDYYRYDVFYRKKDNTKYKYTGWQTIDGKRYYFDKNGNAVTGEQVIQGMKYTFNSDGSLQVNGVMGIDVSKHNGNIDWNAVKNAGVDFVIIRCGYRGSATGVLVEDQKFKANIQGAAAAGLKVGIYFFSQAVNEVEAVEEASMAVSLIKNYKITYPVYMDVESANGRADGMDAGTRTQVIHAFCKTIQNSGYTAGIYANKTWLGSKMNAGALGSYRIWLAQYAAAPTYGGRYEMWQYSSKGSIPGISGDVDLNISYMSY